MTFSLDSINGFALFVCGTLAFQACGVTATGYYEIGLSTNACLRQSLASEDASQATCNCYQDGDDLTLSDTVNLLQTDLHRKDMTSQRVRSIESEASRIPFPHGRFAWEQPSSPSNQSNASSLAGQVATWIQANTAKVNESSPEVSRRVLAFTNYTTTSTAPPTPAPASNSSALLDTRAITLGGEEDLLDANLNNTLHESTETKLASKEADELHLARAPKAVSLVPSAANSTIASASSVLSSVLAQHRRKGARAKQPVAMSSRNLQGILDKSEVKTSASRVVSPRKKVLRTGHRPDKTDLDNLVEEIMRADS